MALWGRNILRNERYNSYCLCWRQFLSPANRTQVFSCSEHPCIACIHLHRASLYTRDRQSVTEMKLAAKWTCWWGLWSPRSKRHGHLLCRGIRGEDEPCRRAGMVTAWHRKSSHYSRQAPYADEQVFCVSLALSAWKNGVWEPGPYFLRCQ